MKHIFVINPCAGCHDSSDEVAAAVDGLELDAELYETKAPRDATRFVAERCAAEPAEQLRFYACGGDGTLNEVVSGAIGHDNAEVACYPCGSGNDFVKYFAGSDFTDLQSQLGASPVEVDVMQLGDRYCVNTLNFGFEAEVCRHMAGARRVPLMGGRMAYTKGIVQSLATGRHNPCRISVDGSPWVEGDMLLASVSNAKWAGGGYMIAPNAAVDDGELDVMCMRPVSLPRFARLIKYYERGEHLRRPEFADVMSYCRGRKVVIESDTRFYIATDGEVIAGDRFEVACLHHALRFVVPPSKKPTPMQ